MLAKEDCIVTMNDWTSEILFKPESILDLLLGKSGRSDGLSMSVVKQYRRGLYLANAETIWMVID